MNRIKIAIGVVALGVGAIGSAFTTNKPSRTMTGWFTPVENEDGIGTISNSATKTAANFPHYYGPTAPASLTVPASGNCSSNAGNVCAAEFTVTSGGGAGTYQSQLVTGQFNY